MQIIRKIDLMRYLLNDEENQWKECFICSFIPTFYHQEVTFHKVSRRKNRWICEISCNEQIYQVEIVLGDTKKLTSSLKDEFHKRVILLCSDVIADHSPVEHNDTGLYYHINQIAMISDAKVLEEWNAPERFIQMIRARSWEIAKEYMYDQTWLQPIVDEKKKRGLYFD